MSLQLKVANINIPPYFQKANPDLMLHLIKKSTAYMPVSRNKFFNMKKYIKIFSN